TNVTAARRGHRDRMKRLHELTQSLKTPDQPELADTARAWFQSAERDLERQPDPAVANPTRRASEPPVDPEEWRRMADRRRRRLRAAEQAGKNLELQPEAADAAQPGPAPEQPPVQPDPATTSAPSTAASGTPATGGMSGMMRMRGMMGSGAMPGMPPPGGMGG